jgi:hypothetical protein
MDPFSRVSEQLKLLQTELEELKLVEELTMEMPSSRNREKMIGRRDEPPLMQQTSTVSKEAGYDRWSDEENEEFVNISPSAIQDANGLAPVHARLFRAGLEQQAKLETLRAQLGGKNSQNNNIPKINDTSRKIVETNRQRSKQIQSSAAATAQAEEIWREYATKDGYLYYYNEATLETRWERPEKGRIVPYLKKSLPSSNGYSVEQAKATMSGK